MNALTIPPARSHMHVHDLREMRRQRAALREMLADARRDARDASSRRAARIRRWWRVASHEDERDWE